MGKNNALIECEKRYRKRFDAMVPKLYASMAVALGDYLTECNPNLTEDDVYEIIAGIFAESQALWIHEDETGGTGDWICQQAIDKYNIDVRYGLNSDVDSVEWRQ